MSRVAKCDPIFKSPEPDGSGPKDKNDEDSITSKIEKRLMGRTSQRISRGGRDSHDHDGSRQVMDRNG